MVEVRTNTVREKDIGIGGVAQIGLVANDDLAVLHNTIDKSCWYRFSQLTI